MKKTSLLALSLCAISLFFAGCAQSAEEDTGAGASLSKIDFRNKDKNGNLFNGRSARAAGSTSLTQEFAGVSRYSNYQFTGLTDEQIAEIITFEDSAAGLKVVFTTPESYKGKIINLLSMTLEDESGSWSTGVEVDKSVIRDENRKVKDTFEFEYPLVHPDVSHTFWFQVYFEDTWGHWGYKVTPVHGKARVDSLPKDYKESDYIKFENGLVVLNDVIPPEALTVNKVVALKLCKNADDKWGGTQDKRLHIEKDLDYGQKLDGYIGDISIGDDGDAVTNMADFPYFFVSMTYSYKIKNFDNLTFTSPTLNSDMYENTFFIKAEAERTVSNTKVESKKVTFAGDGYFDGLYEGDIAVTYGGESFVPAVFVYGLNVYILKVSNGEYSLVTTKTISKYLEEGGSFANVEGDVVFTKLKTDTSEANLDKSTKTEITLK